MKQKHLFALLDQSYVTISVEFDRTARTEKRDMVRPNEERLAERHQRYTYKAPKDAGIAVDDAVVVESPSNGLCIVRVVEVHQTPQIDLDAPFEYKWIVQKVDRTGYDERVARERKFADMMLEVERTRQREQLMNDMRANLPEGSEARKLFDSATALTIDGVKSEGTGNEG